MFYTVFSNHMYVGEHIYACGLIPLSIFDMDNNINVYGCYNTLCVMMMRICEPFLITACSIRVSTGKGLVTQLLKL